MRNGLIQFVLSWNNEKLRKHQKRAKSAIKYLKIFGYLVIKTWVMKAAHAADKMARCLDSNSYSAISLCKFLTSTITGTETESLLNLQSFAW